MKLLVDTQLLLWSASAPKKLSRKARLLLSDEANELYFSAASLWEVAIKNSLGRADFKVSPSLLRRGLLDNGWEELPISGGHAIGVEHLPPLHGDPFDRILLVQAEAEGMALVTTDKALAQYPFSVHQV
jgi:PIN domain nuclease of toxin-antitoxin system